MVTVLRKVQWNLLLEGGRNCSWDVTYKFRLMLQGCRGYGIFFKGKWCAGAWPLDWHKEGITRDLKSLELFLIVRALWLWADE